MRDEKVEACEAGREILKREPDERLEIVSAALERLVNIDRDRVRLRQNYDLRFMTRLDVVRGLLFRLLRARLPYDEERLAVVVEYWAANRRHLTDTSPGSFFIRSDRCAATIR